MSEVWKYWHPVDQSKIVGTYTIGPIDIRSDDLIIIMNGDINNIKFTFYGISPSFKMTNESYRLKTFYDVDKKQGDDFLSESQFFQIENSSYVNWVMDQAYETIGKERWYHFVIFDIEWVIDIVDLEYPKVEIIDK